MLKLSHLIFKMHYHSPGLSNRYTDSHLIPETSLINIAHQHANEYHNTINNTVILLNTFFFFKRTTSVRHLNLESSLPPLLIFISAVNYFTCQELYYT